MNDPAAPRDATTRAGRSTIGLQAAGVLLPAVILAGFALKGIFSGDGPPATSLTTVRPSQPPDMVLLPGGLFRMGDDLSSSLDERPAHDVAVAPLRFDRHEVTNRQFAAFVRGTNYATTAENQGWSWVFDRRGKAWGKRPGADWRHPGGPDTRIDGRDDYPVVQVSWSDARAYADWAGKRLPTEAEWEYAARAGLHAAPFPWGPEETVAGRYQANYWQGHFPDKDLALDGFDSLAPIASFPANRFGLYDMAGNAWEWCQDYYAADYYRMSPDVDPTGPAQGEQRVVRGGSWLSAENVAAAYRVAARGKRPPGSSYQDVGFRCVRSAASVDASKE